MKFEDFNWIPPLEKQKGEEQVERVFSEQVTKTLSRLYKLICSCRRHEKGLKQLLNPKAHLEDCLYRIKVEPIGIQFKEE